MLVRFAAPRPGETGLLVLLRPGRFLPKVLQLGLVVVASVALAFAGRDSSEFVSPSLFLGTGHLDALRASVSRGCSDNPGSSAATTSLCRWSWAGGARGHTDQSTPVP